MENAALNGVGHLVISETSEGLNAPVMRENKPFDLIVANILAWPLMRMAPQMHAYTENGSHLILSGILATQRNRVIAAYRTMGFAHRRTTWDDEWVTFIKAPLSDFYLQKAKSDHAGGAMTAFKCIYIIIRGAI